MKISLTAAVFAQPFLSELVINFLRQGIHLASAFCPMFIQWYLKSDNVLTSAIAFQNNVPFLPHNYADTHLTPRFFS